MVTVSIYKHNEKSMLRRNNVLNTVDNWRNRGGTVYQTHTMTKAEAERIVKTLDKCSFFLKIESMLSVYANMHVLQ